MPGKPSINGVVERDNKTLKEHGKKYDKSFFFTRITLGRNTKDCSIHSK